MDASARKRSEAAKKAAKTRAAQKHAREQWERRQNAEPEAAEPSPTREAVSACHCGRPLPSGPRATAATRVCVCGRRWDRHVNERGDWWELTVNVEGPVETL